MGGKVRVRYLTQDQAKSLLDRLPSHQREVVLFALATGLRQGNILSLTWEQVDLTRRIATIEHGDTENGEALGVPPNAVALGILERDVAPAASGAGWVEVADDGAPPSAHVTQAPRALCRPADVSGHI